MSAIKYDKEYLKRHTYCYCCEQESVQEWFKFAMRDIEEQDLYPHSKYIFKRMRAHETKQSSEDTIPILISLCISVCKNCGKYLIWDNGEIVYEDVGELIHPHPKLPPLSRDLYNEARKIYKISSKSAAALLRLSIEELIGSFLSLDLNEGSLSAIVKELLEKHQKGLIEIPQHIIAALTHTSLLNSNLNSGEIDLNENEENVLLLFYLVNEIAMEFIERRQRIKEFEKKLPLKLKK